MSHPLYELMRGTAEPAVSVLGRRHWYPDRVGPGRTFGPDVRNLTIWNVEGALWGISSAVNDVLRDGMGPFR